MTYISPDDAKPLPADLPNRAAEAGDSSSMPVPSETCTAS